MPIYNANDIIEVQFLMRANAGEFRNQVYFKVKALTPQATTVSVELRDQYWSSYGLIISNQISFYGIASRRVSPNPQVSYTQEAFTIRAGLAISNSGADGLCNIIVLNHGNASGRKGRMYSPLPPNGAFINGAMDSIHVGRLNSCVNGLTARYRDGGSSPWLVQCVKTRLTPNTPYFWQPVDSFTFRGFMGWQRSRVAGRGI